VNYRQRDNDGLWWQIALGIFVGQLMTAALAGVVMLIIGSWAAREITVQLPRTVPRTVHPARSLPPSNRPLGADERCIAHERFRRLANGWQELPNDPC